MFSLLIYRKVRCYLSAVAGTGWGWEVLLFSAWLFCETSGNTKIIMLIMCIIESIFFILKFTQSGSIKLKIFVSGSESRRRRWFLWLRFLEFQKFTCFGKIWLVMVQLSVELKYLDDFLYLFWICFVETKHGLAHQRQRHFFLFEHHYHDSQGYFGTLKKKEQSWMNVCFIEMLLDAK